MRIAAKAACLLIFSLAALLSPGAIAQEALASVSIKAVDEATGSPVADVALSAKGPVEARKLAPDGAWTFSGLPAGTYELRAWAPGFAEKLGRLTLDPSQKKEYAGTVKLKRLAVAEAEAEVQESGKPSLEGPALAAKPKQAPAARKAESSAKEIAKSLGSPLQAQAQGAAKSELTPPAPGSEESFMGFPKRILGILAIAMAFVIVADIVAFSAIFALKWSKLGSRGRLGLSLGGTASGCMSFILLAFTVFGYFVASKSDEEPFKPQALQEQAAAPQAKPEPKAAPQAQEEEAGAQAKAAHEKGVAIVLESPGSQEGIRKALPFLEEAFFAEPGNVQYALDLADCYVQASTILSLNLAADIYGGLLAREPGSDMLLGRLADASLKLKRYDKAFSYAARRTWSKTSSPLQGISQLMLIAIASGQLDRGIQELERALLGDPPERPQILMAIAALNAEAGRKEKAIAAFDAALAELPAQSELAEKARALKAEAAK